MANDATQILIQRIRSQLSQGGGTNSDLMVGLLKQASDIVSTTANYAQILSTAEGPVAQLAASAIVRTVAADAAGEAAILATFGATGVGAVVVLLTSVILAFLAGQNESSQSTALASLIEQLNQVLGGINNTVLTQYWQSKTNDVGTAWNDGQGGLGVDLDNLAAGGTNGLYVTASVGKFHNDGLGFVDAFIPSASAGTGSVFWSRPFFPNQAFSTHPFPYLYANLQGWYGDIDKLRLIPATQSDTTVPDPRTMLPFLTLGLHSYLTVQSLVNFIDPTQIVFNAPPPQQSFLRTYGGDLAAYSDFLSAQYSLAVNGLVKADDPGVRDILTYVCNAVLKWKEAFKENLWGGSSMQYNVDSPSAGYAWNGIYGCVSLYPLYGAYQPQPPPFFVPCSLPESIIDVLDTSNIWGNLGEAFFKEPSWHDPQLNDWTLPWAQNKARLGTMARWKALYLYDGFDHVWSMIQTLRDFAGLPVQPPMRLTQDGTLAMGSWSARELCALINADGNILDGVSNGSIQTTFSIGIYGYSLAALAAGLDNIAHGNWGGHPSPLADPHGQHSPSRPLGLRDRLAAAAV